MCGELKTNHRYCAVHEDLQAWTLNFNGRVKIASKKNFLLSPTESDAMENEFGAGTTILRFGKRKKHRFTLDYRYPFSPVQALATVMTHFAKKLVVT